MTRHATLLGTRATPEGVAALHKQSAWTSRSGGSTCTFLGRLLHGDLGTSFFYRAARQRAWSAAGSPADALAAGRGTVIALLITVPLAVLAASRRGSAADQAIRAVPLSGWACRRSGSASC